jgi:hypothetical protein
MGAVTLTALPALLKMPMRAAQADAILRAGGWALLT